MSKGVSDRIMAEDHAAEDFQKIDRYVMGSDNDTRTDTKTDGKSSITWSKCSSTLCT